MQSLRTARTPNFVHSTRQMKKAFAGSADSCLFVPPLEHFLRPSVAMGSALIGCELPVGLLYSNFGSSHCQIQCMGLCKPSLNQQVPLLCSTLRPRVAQFHGPLKRSFHSREWVVHCL